ncbi:hypothetical protein ACLB2K_073583 [Fragaria x ananassa]
MRPRAALLFLREHWAWACISPFLNSFSRSLSTPPNHLHQEIQPDLKLFFPLFRHFLHRFGTCYESSVLISGFIDWVIHQETRFTGIISFDGGWEASYREVSRLCIRDAWKAAQVVVLFISSESGFVKIQLF